MSDLYDILDPWGPSTASAAAGPLAVAGAHGDEDALRGCLDKTALPPVYAAAYSAALKAGDGQVTRDALQKTLALAGLPRHILGQIVLAADTGAEALTQRDFNLALAMAALAQQGMPPTLESVMFHRDRLPPPALDGIEALGAGSAAGESDDPWLGAAQSGARAGAAKGSGDDWGGGAGAAAVASTAAELDAMAIAAGGTAKKEQQQPGPVVPNISMDEMQWRLDVEDVAIKEAAEKGGIVFKHTNYEVRTRSFTSMVVRRYSDFSWISDYLVRRYPYRMHANIPPKGFAVDRQFLDNRLKGLTRFANAVLRTPFLRRDALVIQFFTNTDEFAHVLRVGNLDMDVEEIDPDDELRPTPWAEAQDTYAAFPDFYAQVARDEEKYRLQITALEKTARYKRAIGDELCAYSDTLRTANAPRESVSGSRKFHVQPPAKRALDGGLNELSMSFGDASLLEKSHGEVLKTISAEHLRRLYDVVVSMKLMMDRMRQSDKRKDIQRVRERSDASRKQLAQAAEAPAADRSAVERLERLVRDDAAELERLEHEQRCIEARFYQELARYRCSESFLRRHYREYIEEQIKHHTLALNAWKQALATAGDLPEAPLGFIS